MGVIKNIAYRSKNSIKHNRKEPILTCQCTKIHKPLSAKEEKKLISQTINATNKKLENIETTTLVTNCIELNAEDT